MSQNVKSILLHPLKMVILRGAIIKLQAGVFPHSPHTSHLTHLSLSTELSSPRSVQSIFLHQEN